LTQNNLSKTQEKVLAPDGYKDKEYFFLKKKKKKKKGCLDTKQKYTGKF